MQVKQYYKNLHNNNKFVVLDSKIYSIDEDLEPKSIYGAEINDGSAKITFKRKIATTPRLSGVNFITFLFNFFLKFSPQQACDKYVPGGMVISNYNQFVLIDNNDGIWKSNNITDGMEYDFIPYTRGFYVHHLVVKVYMFLLYFISYLFPTYCSPPKSKNIDIAFDVTTLIETIESKALNQGVVNIVEILKDTLKEDITELNLKQLDLRSSLEVKDDSNLVKENPLPEVHSNLVKENPLPEVHSNLVRENPSPEVHSNLISEVRENPSPEVHSNLISEVRENPSPEIDLASSLQLLRLNSTSEFEEREDVGQLMEDDEADERILQRLKCD
jgi:hypothetical protein